MAEQANNLEADQSSRDQAKWLKIAVDAYNGSTGYLDTSIRGQWERNLYNFNGRDKDGSRNDHAAKVFRPKIRSAIRAHEASLAVALFSNSDLLTAKPADPNNKVQAASAKLNQALAQHRLEKSIPWFATAMGMYQDTHVYGVCISKAYWKYETRDLTEVVAKLVDGEMVIDEDGYAEGEEVVVGQEVVKDEPCIDTLAPENFRFDPNSDWRNPVEDSPYLIEQIPMYAGDVINKMGSTDDKIGHPPWRTYTLEQLISHGTGDLTGGVTRRAREGERTDPKSIGVRSEYTQVWVHFNIVKEGGVDMAYYTIGTSLLLSEPVPLTEYFELGRETYTVGISSIESHKTYPAGSAELAEDLQNATNIIANQRIKNVRLALNKRYFIKRQGDVDLGALMRNVAGGGVMLDDPHKDVNIVSTPDVTSSSYAEQDRINMDMDEILGTFSPSSVQSNRALNETVGGMNLMNSGANQLQEYTIRTFIESWVQPVIRTLVKLEQLYETSETILGVAGNKAGIQDQLQQMFKMPDMLDRFIKQELLITVNVGMGNTNPEQKMNRLMAAVNTSASIPEMAARTDYEEVNKELYAFAGYGDGERFIKKDDGEKEEQAPPPEVQIEQMKIQATQQVEKMKAQTRLQEVQFEQQAKREIEMARLAAQQNMKISELKVKLGIEASKDKTNRDVAVIGSQTANREMDIKISQGSGI